MKQNENETTAMMEHQRQHLFIETFPDTELNEDNIHDIMNNCDIKVLFDDIIQMKEEIQNIFYEEEKWKIELQVEWIQREKESGQDESEWFIDQTREHAIMVCNQIEEIQNEIEKKRYKATKIIKRMIQNENETTMDETVINAYLRDLKEGDYERIKTSKHFIIEDDGYMYSQYEDELEEALRRLNQEESAIVNADILNETGSFYRYLRLCMES